MARRSAALGGHGTPGIFLKLINARQRSFRATVDAKDVNEIIERR
jgi:hypothetical protein